MSDSSQSDDCGLDAAALEKLLQWKMPFGRFKGQPLVHLPFEYVVWFRRKGFPKGELGLFLKSLCQFHEDGSIDVLRQVYYSHLNTQSYSK